MRVDELSKMIAQAYGMAVDQGIFFAFLTQRDVCVSTSGPFQSELVGPTEQPSFHAVVPYVRYHIASSQVDQYGKPRAKAEEQAPAPAPKAETDTQVHNRVAPDMVRQIVAEAPVEADAFVILESVVLGVVQFFRPQRDHAAEFLDMLTANVVDRMK